MEIVVLSMAAVCFMFGLIAITRVDQISKEGQKVKINWRNPRETQGQRSHNQRVTPW